MQFCAASVVAALIDLNADGGRRRHGMLVMEMLHSGIGAI